MTKVKNWIEKYEPRNLDDFFSNRKVLQNLKKLQTIDSPYNLCFVGETGSAKKSIVKLFLNENADPKNIFYLNHLSYKTIESKEVVHEFINFKNGKKKKFVVLENFSKFSVKFTNFLYVLLTDPNIVVVTILNDKNNLFLVEKNSVIFETKSPTVNELYEFGKTILCAESVCVNESELRKCAEVNQNSYTKFIFYLQSKFALGLEFKNFVQIPIDVDNIMHNTKLYERFMEIDKLLKQGFCVLDISEQIYNTLIIRNENIHNIILFGENLVWLNNFENDVCSLYATISKVWLNDNINGSSVVYRDS